MKKIIVSIIGLSLFALPLAASAMSVVRYEAQTSLSARWEKDEANRQLIRARIHDHQTNLLTGATNEAAVAANVVEVRKYSNAVQCVLAKDQNRCANMDERLQQL